MNKNSSYILYVCITASFLMPLGSNAEEKLKASGFATITLSQTDGDYPYVQGETDDYSFKPRSLAGLQFDYTVNEDTDFVVQVTADAVSNWDTSFEWAFFRYKLMPNVSVRAGRMRTPGYMLSDYVKIGYAYPWIAPPSEVYDQGADISMDGMDLIYKSSLSDDWSFYVRPYIGAIDDNSGAVTNDLMGAEFNFSSETLTISLGYRTAKLTFAEDYVLDDLVDQVYDALGQTRPADSAVEDQRVGFYSGGFTYDNGTLLLMGEYTGYSWEEETLLPAVSGSYLTAGWRFGKIMPHLTFSKMRTDEDEIYDFPDVTVPVVGTIENPVNSLLDSSLDRDQETWTLGIRWDFKPNVAFKAEYQRIGGFNGTSGLFTVPIAVPQEVVLDEDDSDINLYRIALTGAF